MYTPNLHIAILYDTTLVNVVGALRDKKLSIRRHCVTQIGLTVFSALAR